MRTRLLWIGLLSMLSVSLANASPIIIPPGVSPRSAYHLAFVTAEEFSIHSGLRTIEDFDAIVTAEANRGPALAAILGATWKVIGSTRTESAVEHLAFIDLGDTPQTRGRNI